MQETGVRSLIWGDPKRHGATKPVCACLVAQSCPTLCNHMDRSPPGFSGHGLSQATMLGWVAISSPRGSCQPRDGTPISCSLCTGKEPLGGLLTTEPPGKPSQARGPRLLSLCPRAREPWLLSPRAPGPVLRITGAHRDERPEHRS